VLIWNLKVENSFNRLKLKETKIQHGPPRSLTVHRAKIHSSITIIKSMQGSCSIRTLLCSRGRAACRKDQLIGNRNQASNKNN